MVCPSRRSRSAAPRPPRPAIAGLLDDFNREFSEPTPGVAVLTERCRELLAAGEITALLAADGPDGHVLLAADGPDGHALLATDGPDGHALLATDGPDGHVLLAAGGPAGLALLRFRPALWEGALEAHLQELYVVPALRGRGIGRALLTAAIGVARAAGAVGIDLNTGETDTAARGLYASMGFSNREGGPDGPAMLFYEREI